MSAITIEVKATLLMTLKDKQEWINKIPRHLPVKRYYKEEFLWLDKNGNQFVMGEDFEAAEKLDTYPVSIYRLERVSDKLREENK